MSILRYTASADTTITNAYKSGLMESSRATGSNMGLADSLETFSIYGQATSSAGYSQELSRILLKFPVSTISSNRDTGLIPLSGSVDFYLRLFNVVHPFTLPKKYYLTVAGITKDWEEGIGLDMETYSDKDEASWINCTSTKIGATATVNFAGALTVGETLTIVDAAGKSVAYEAAEVEDASASPNPKFENVSGGVVAIATSLKVCIDSANGHNGTIIATLGADGLLTLQQSMTNTTLTTPATDMVDSGLTNTTLVQWAGGLEKTPWTIIGGDFHTGTYTPNSNLPHYKTYFEKGHEDLELDITSLVEEWIATDEAATVNYGLGVFLSASYEAYNSNSSGIHTTGSLHNLEGAKRSYYTKKFSARGTEFFFKQPLIEARWNSAKKDDTGNFYLSSSMLSATDNLNSLYFYNYYGGHLKDLPTGAVTLKIYSGQQGNAAATATVTFGGAPNDGETLTITDTAGKSVAYTAATDEEGTNTSLTPPRFESIAGGATAIAAGLGECILSGNGHNGTITVTNNNDGSLTLQQAVTGAPGNTVLVDSGLGGNNPAIITFTNFSGGTSTDISVPTGSILGYPLGGDNSTAVGAESVTATKVSTGVYSASFAYASSSITSIFPVWSLGAAEIHTGSAVAVKTHNASDYNPSQDYVTNIKNIKASYSRNETTRFRVTTRQRDWSPTIYTVASKDPEIQTVESASFRVFRMVDDIEAISFGTSSTLHTQLSYDASGSYFDLDMSMFESGYMYGIQLAFYMNQDWREQKEVFKFRVE